ncbi:putative short chain dehydrogenase [Encephalitozoon intestinalis ATCC 50506]|uniref:Short chain dehydrogenase n=1 Tax=Encephalitozoon intestinalis (strain ATCC 50506) TaxID=876142 RepID=E0S8T0_ENCIT|nr:putative short chain dehydrogenase [Encephalitozoon intestinalis ATCC 50506]ADM12047.1 putative short chain dehydrogenase [Encephalitozoon intestinalis ATCC 50506]UTX45836.1 7B-hydroxysteroid dehydrogenase [Encephalitozoon intestinalis]
MVIQLIYLGVSYMMLKILPTIYQYIYSKCRNHQVWEGLKKKYVLINGATGKVGMGLARKFAEKGMKILLVGRSESRLTRLHAKIGRMTECHMHIVDYKRNPNLSFIERYDIGILINCVSAIEDSPAYFVEQTVEDIMNANLVGVMSLTRHVLVNMMDSGYGYVINIGSLMAEASTPLYSAFGCSKQALKTLSDSLYYELSGYNINIEYMGVGNVSCEDYGEKSSFLRPSSDTLASSILGTFGSAKMSIPYFPHFIMYLLMLCIPSPLLSRLVLHKNRQEMLEMRNNESSFEERKVK